MEAIKDKIDEYLERMAKIVNDNFKKEKAKVKKHRMADRM